MFLQKFQTCHELQLKILESRMAETFILRQEHVEVVTEM
jgi:hypothetical protein